MEQNTAVDDRIEQFAHEFEAQHRALLDGLDPTERAALESRLLAFNDSLIVAIVFFQAVHQIGALGPLALTLPPLMLQLLNLRGNDTSGRLIAGMIATNTCTVLEDYLKTQALPKITKSMLATLRATQTLPKDDAKASRKVLNTVKPSCRQAGSEWLSALKTVFDVTVSQDEQDSLLEMISFRNEYVHDPATAGLRNVTGEAIKCWSLASRLLCQRVAIG